MTRAANVYGMPRVEINQDFDFNRRSINSPIVDENSVINVAK